MIEQMVLVDLAWLLVWRTWVGVVWGNRCGAAKYGERQKGYTSDWSLRVRAPKLIM